MDDPTIEALRQNTASGDPIALTRLGQRLLGGSTPADLPEGASALDRATRAGGAEAPAILAMLFALGVGAPLDWTTALDLLQISAERGSDLGRGQLLALAGEPVDPLGEAEAPPERWRRLRQSIDPATWSRPGPREMLRRSPRVYTHDQFLSPQACDWVIARAAGRVKPALVFDPDAPGLKVEDARSNSAFELSFEEMDVVLAMIRLRIAAMVGVDPSVLEAPQVLHYRVGQKFDDHYDFFDPNLPGHRDQIGHGQRTVTCLVYLNADFEGGETDFPIIGLRRKTPVGGALCFDNVQASGTPDRRTLHAGLAPTQGEKWLLSQWIRQPPA